MSSMSRAAEAPKITTVEDILARMRMGVKDVHEITFRQMVFPVRVLTLDEVAAIRREAMSKAAPFGGDETEKNLHIQKVTLKMASTLSPGGAPLISDSLLKALTVDEMRFLYDEYIRVLDSVNPSYETISSDEFRALVDALKKNSVGARDCSLQQLRAICTAFVELIQQAETQS